MYETVELLIIEFFMCGGGGRHVNSRSAYMLHSMQTENIMVHECCMPGYHAICDFSRTFQCGFYQ